MKEKKSVSKNVFMVCLSSILSIVISLFMGFVLPKQIDVENYAYYRIYNLYVAYAGFFHFGLVNGIYLQYGDLDYNQIPKAKFKNYLRFMIILQFLVVAILSTILFIFSSYNNKNENIAWLFVFINIPLINIKWFFSSINQFTKRFVIDSYVTIFQNFLNVCMVILITVFELYTYLSILVFTTFINFICMCIVIYQNKEIILEHHVNNDRKELFELIKTGFFLMLSEFVGIIILGIDSIFADMFFTIREFAMYSFATTIVSIIFTLITSVSNLVYPYLVRVDSTSYARYYTILSDILAVIAMLSLVMFHFAKIIVLYWLPNYEDSIIIAGILFGTIVFRVLLSLVCGNYFKVLKMVKDYTINNIMAILLAFLFNVVALIIFRKLEYIAVASVLAFIFWYVITDFKFIKRLQIKFLQWIPRYIFILLNLIMFYAFINAGYVYGIIIYVIIVIITASICFFMELKRLKH